MAGVLATLAPDVEHDIVGWPAGPAHGREAARPFYETLFTDLSDGSVKSLRRLYGENSLVDESLWHGKAPGKPFGIEGSCRPLEFRLLHIIEFDAGGAIKRENSGSISRPSAASGLIGWRAPQRDALTRGIARARICCRRPAA